MKTLKKTLLVVAAIAAQVIAGAIWNEAPAQTEKNQIGVRLGGYSGINYRRWDMIGNGLGMEFTLMGWAPYHGAMFSGLVEKNIPLGPENFYLYFGGGIFAGNYGYRAYYYYDDFDRRWYIGESRTYVGLEAVIGADYYFRNAPLVAGLDLRPRFFKFIYPYPWDAGINVRYRF